VFFSIHITAAMLERIKGRKFKGGATLESKNKICLKNTNVLKSI